MQSVQQSVQVPEHVAAVRRANLASKIADARIGLRQRRVAQEQARRKTLDGTAHDAVGILCLDFAVDVDA